MKIAMIHTPLVTPTGGERQILKLAIELQKNGHEVEIFTNEANYKRCFPELISQVKINIIPYPLNFELGYYKILLGMLKIGKEVSKRQFDIINNHNFPTEWAVYFAKNKINIPAVWMCNEPPFWFLYPEARKGLKRVHWPLFELFDKMSIKSLNKIVVLSNLMGNIVKKTYNRDFVVVRSGIDIEQFKNISNEEFREKYGLEDSFILLQVGTLTYYKRQEDSIKALYLLSKKYKNLKLVFIGTARGYKEYLLKLIKAYNLRDKVLFLSSISDDELKQAYASSDVFLFPGFQSWSLATVEAMASKKPVIVSNKCGVSEIIINDINGFTVNHGDYRTMARYMDMLINNEDLKKKIGKNAYKFVKENLSWERYAKNMENIFKEALE